MMALFERELFTIGGARLRSPSPHKLPVIRNRKRRLCAAFFPDRTLRLYQPAITGPPIKNVMTQTIANTAMLPHTSQLACSTDMSLSPR